MLNALSSAATASAGQEGLAPSPPAYENGNVACVLSQPPFTEFCTLDAAVSSSSGGGGLPPRPLIRGRYDGLCATEPSQRQNPERFESFSIGPAARAGSTAAAAAATADDFHVNPCFLDARPVAHGSGSGNDATTRGVTMGQHVLERRAERRRKAMGQQPSARPVSHGALLFQVEPFSRSSAGKVLEPDHLRTPLALEKTMHFLVEYYLRSPHTALCFTDPFKIWGYLWDRLRSIRTTWVPQLPLCSAGFENYMDESNRRLLNPIVLERESRRRMQWLEFTVAALSVGSVYLCRTVDGCRRFVQEKKNFLESISQCFTDLTIWYRVEQRAQHAEFVSLLLLLYGLKQESKAEDRATFCPFMGLSMTDGSTLTVPEPVGASVNLSQAYKELEKQPHLIQTQPIRAAVKLINTWASGKWFEFFYLCKHEALTPLQRSFLFQSFSYARFRAILDLVVPVNPVFPRLRWRNAIPLATLTDLLMFQCEAHCVEFLTVMGLADSVDRSAGVLQLSRSNTSEPLVTAAAIEERCTSKADLLMPTHAAFFGFHVWQEAFELFPVKNLCEGDQGTVQQLRAATERVTQAKARAFLHRSSADAQLLVDEALVTELEARLMQKAACPVNLMEILEPYCPPYNEDVARLTMVDVPVADVVAFGSLQAHREAMLLRALRRGNQPLGGALLLPCTSSEAASQEAAVERMLDAFETESAATDLDEDDLGDGDAGLDTTNAPLSDAANDADKKTEDEESDILSEAEEESTVPKSISDSRALLDSLREDSTYDRVQQEMAAEKQEAERARKEKEDQLSMLKQKLLQQQQERLEQQKTKKEIDEAQERSQEHEQSGEEEEEEEGHSVEDKKSTEEQPRDTAARSSTRPAAPVLALPAVGPVVVTPLPNDYKSSSSHPATPAVSTQATVETPKSTVLPTTASTEFPAFPRFTATTTTTTTTAPGDNLSLSQGLAGTAAPKKTEEASVPPAPPSPQSASSPFSFPARRSEAVNKAASPFGTASTDARNPTIPASPPPQVFGSSGSALSSTKSSQPKPQTTTTTTTEEPSPSASPLEEKERKTATTDAREGAPSRSRSPASREESIQNLSLIPRRATAQNMSYDSTSGFGVSRLALDKTPGCTPQGASGAGTAATPPRRSGTVQWDSAQYAEFSHIKGGRSVSKEEAEASGQGRRGTEACPRERDTIDYAGRRSAVRREVLSRGSLLSLTSPAPRHTQPFSPSMTRSLPVPARARASLNSSFPQPSLFFRHGLAPLVSDFLVTAAQCIGSRAPAERALRYAVQCGEMSRDGVLHAWRRGLFFGQRSAEETSAGSHGSTVNTSRRVLKHPTSSQSRFFASATVQQLEDRTPFPRTQERVAGVYGKGARELQEEDLMARRMCVGFHPLFATKESAPAVGEGESERTGALASAAKRPRWEPPSAASSWMPTHEPFTGPLRRKQPRARSVSQAREALTGAWKGIAHLMPPGTASASAQANPAYVVGQLEESVLPVLSSTASPEGGFSVTSILERLQRLGNRLAQDLEHPSDAAIADLLDGRADSDAAVASWPASHKTATTGASGLCLEANFVLVSSDGSFPSVYRTSPGSHQGHRHDDPDAQLIRTLVEQEEEEVLAQPQTALRRQFRDAFEFAVASALTNGAAASSSARGSHPPKIPAQLLATVCQKRPLLYLSSSSAGASTSAAATLGSSYLATTQLVATSLQTHVNLYSLGSAALVTSMRSARTRNSPPTHANGVSHASESGALFPALSSLSATTAPAMCASVTPILCFDATLEVPSHSREALNLSVSSAASVESNFFSPTRWSTLLLAIDRLMQRAAEAEAAHRMYTPPHASLAGAMGAIQEDSFVRIPGILILALLPHASSGGDKDASGTLRDIHTRIAQAVSNSWQQQVERFQREFTHSGGKASPVSVDPSTLRWRRAPLSTDPIPAHGTRSETSLSSTWECRSLTGKPLPRRSGLSSTTDEPDVAPRCDDDGRLIPAVCPVEVLLVPIRSPPVPASKPASETDEDEGGAGLVKRGHAVGEKPSRSTSARNAATREAAGTSDAERLSTAIEQGVMNGMYELLRRYHRRTAAVLGGARHNAAQGENEGGRGDSAAGIVSVRGSGSYSHPWSPVGPSPLSPPGVSQGFESVV